MKTSQSYNKFKYKEENNIFSKGNLSLIFLSFRTVLLFSISLLINSTDIDSQSWNKLSGLPTNTTIKQIEIANNGTLYALTNEDYPFYSTDDGLSWQAFDTPPFSSYLLNVRSFHVNKTNNSVFFGTALSGISYATNLGANWGQEFLSTNPVSALHETVSHITSSNDTILISGDYSILASIQRYFYSTNNGVTWSDVEQGIGIAEDIILDQSKWVVATNHGIQVSTDMGNSWNVLAFNNASLYSCRSIIKVSSNNYYCILFNFTSNQFEVHQSADLSAWNLKYSFNTANFFSANYAPQTNAILIATSNGLIKFNLDTNSATELVDISVNEALESSLSNSIQYCTDTKPGIIKSNTTNNNWSTITNGFYSTSLYNTDNFFFKNNKLYTTSTVSRIISTKSNLIEDNWDYSIPLDTNYTQNTNNTILKKNNTCIFAGGQTNIYRTEDDGINWTSITKPSMLPFNNSGYRDIQIFSAPKNNHLYLAQNNDNGKLYRSNDNGNTWQVVFSNNDVTIPIIKFTNVISDQNSIVYASYFTNSLQNKIIKSTDGGLTWMDYSDPFLNTLSSDFQLHFDQTSNLYISSITKIIKMPSQGVFNEIEVPWNIASGDIYKIHLAFDIHNNMLVCLSGATFCSECGVYRLNNSNWEFLSTPELINPISPVTGMELLYDSIPVVKTNFTFAQGNISDMGYYYYSSIVLNSNDIESKTELAAYPNPTTGLINFEMKELVGKIDIYNQLGQIVISKTIENNSTNSLDLQFLNSGIYIAKFSSKNGNFYRRILKS